jgi:hypothetical protein
MDSSSSPSTSYMSSYCTPAQIYLVFGIILMIVTSIKTKPSILSVIIHSLYIIFWTLLLNFICSKGYVGVSWFLLLLPVIFIVGILIVGVAIYANKSHS